MKRLLLPLMALTLSVGAYAQKKLTDGTISYDIVINTSGDRPQAADFFDGATSVVYIKGARSRTEMISSLGTQSTLIDEARNSIVVLKEYGAQRFMIQMTPAEWKEANTRYGNIKFTFHDGEEKTLLGYKARKATGQLADGTRFTVWYTTELVPEHTAFQFTHPGLPGLALQYETDLGGMKLTYTVSKISFSPVPAAKFDLPKSGYRVITYAESRGGR